MLFCQHRGSNLGRRALGASIPLALVAAMVMLLAAAQIRGALAGARERRQTAEELAALKTANRAFLRAAEESSTRLNDLNELIETRTSEQRRKVVSELQVLESLMRDFAANLSEKAKDGDAVAAPAPAAAAQSASYLEGVTDPVLLEMIRTSLEQNRVDLYLQPIVSLPQRKLRFYEALSRLRAEDGTVIMPEQYMRVAAPAGLMSVVDNLLLFRCVQVVRKLTQKQRDMAVFCNIAGDTLRDGEFFPQFLDYMHHNRDLAGHIVFEFAQETVLNADAQVEANLAYLANMGFALSMDHVATPPRLPPYQGAGRNPYQRHGPGPGSRGGGRFQKPARPLQHQSDCRTGGNRKDGGRTARLCGGLRTGLSVRRTARGARRYAETGGTAGQHGRDHSPPPRGLMCWHSCESVKKPVAAGL